MEPLAVSPPGRLLVVATPLGHLGDLTTRAADVLRSVGVVAAEDTRHTRRLLAHLGAHPRLLSVHAHADPSRLEAVLTLLRAGSDVALVTDAGTPVVSDPGASLVALAAREGIPVVPVPGPSAVATALSVSGLPGDQFLFLGFLPRKGPAREHLLARAASEPWVVVFYEAPGRLVRLLEDLGRVAGGERHAVVGRELTKVHEEVARGTLAELASRFAAAPVRGEVTVLLAGAPASEPATVDVEALSAEASRLLAGGMSRREAARRLTESSGISRNEAYRLVMELP